MIALHDKHVLVTGGASGIGRLLALGRACGGAAVTILYLDEDVPIASSRPCATTIPSCRCRSW